MDSNLESLRAISRKHSKTIPQLLSDIQRCQSTQQKDVSILKRLECLHISKQQRAVACKSIAGATNPKIVRMWRHQIDATKEKNYIALSYTWVASEYESDASGSYEVQESSGRAFHHSPVRATIFDRIIRYMNTINVSLLWIDRHCIDQDTCKDQTCPCVRCDRKARALQAMDLVYSKSSHPVALLSRPIESRYELELLADIMKKRFKAGDRSMTGRMRTRAQRALRLLELMTNDLWWTRGWTFQENYRAGINMKLLIPLSPELEGLKYLMGVSITDQVDGELCIKSVDFMEAVTFFCEEYQKAKRHQNGAETRVIQEILSKTRKYTIILPRDAFMFPAIASDLSKRKLREPLDILEIIANCCQYPLYLDKQELLRNGASRNLSILAMCLINGEILNNNRSGPYPVSGMNVFEYLEKLCLPSFAAPSIRDLTYRKGCRFHPVSLHEVGIKTEGYLWELGDIIDTRYLRKSSRRAYPMFNNERFSKKEVDQLIRLTNKFGGYWRNPLADGIQKLIRSGSIGENITFARRYMEAMAKEVARAVAKGHQLRLGRLCGGRGPQQQTAIFLSSHKWTYRLPEKEHQGYVFTSSLDNENENDVHRHVCLEVSWVGSDDNIPRLHTRRGILGLCFFQGHRPEEIIFPWPFSLLDVSP